MSESSGRSPLVIHQESGLPAQRMVWRHQTFAHHRTMSKASFWKYWEVLNRRRRWILGFILVIVPLWTLVTFLRTPVFKATALVQITSDNPSSIVAGSKESMGNLFNWEGRQEFAQTQFQILQSRTLAQRIVEKLNLQSYPEFKPEKDLPADMSMKLVVDKFLKNLDIKPERNSFLVRVSYESTDPSLSQAVANALVEEYRQFGMESRSQAFTAVQKWLDHQLQNLRAKVESSEKQLYHFAEKENIVNPESKENVVLQKYSDLSNLLTKAEADRVAKEALYRQIQAGGLDSPVILNNPLIIKLREEVAVQESKVASLGKVFKSGHPELQTEQAKLGQLRSRLNGEVARLANAIKADYESAKRTEEMLHENLNSQKQLVAKLQRQTVNYKIFKRDVEVNDALYKGLLARMKEASIASTMVPTNVQVIDEAERPVKPSRPNKALHLVLASIFGLCGGVGLAFVVDHLDDSIKNIEDFEESCQLPVLGLVPALASPQQMRFLPGPQNPSLNYLHDYHSEMSEAIRQLKAVILLADIDNPPRTLAVTSPNPGEGKTTIAANLACSLAMQGRKVLLIDADLKRPQLHRIFNRPISPGLSDFLQGRSPIGQIIQATELPNLDIIGSGNSTWGSSEILGSEVLALSLKELAGQWHHVIVDSPPVLCSADGLVLSAFTDGVILVVRHLSTSLEAGCLAQQYLQKVHASVIGTVINYADFKSYGYPYYYHYYQKNKASHPGAKSSEL